MRFVMEFFTGAAPLNDLMTYINGLPSTSHVVHIGEVIQAGAFGLFCIIDTGV